MNLVTVFKAFQSYSEEAVDTKDKGDEEQILLDLDEGVFVNNLGIPLIVVANKVCPPTTALLYLNLIIMFSNFGVLFYSYVLALTPSPNRWMPLDSLRTTMTTVRSILTLYSITCGQ